MTKAELFLYAAQFFSGCMVGSVAAMWFSTQASVVAGFVGTMLSLLIFALMLKGVRG